MDVFALVGEEIGKRKRVVKGWLQLKDKGIGKAVFVKYNAPQLFAELFGDAYVLEYFKLVASCVVQDAVFWDKVEVTVFDTIKNNVFIIVDDNMTQVVKRAKRKVIVYNAKAFSDCFSAIVYAVAEAKRGVSEWKVQRFTVTVKDEGTGEEKALGVVALVRAGLTQ